MGRMAGCRNTFSSGFCTCHTRGLFSAASRCLCRGRSPMDGEMAACCGDGMSWESGPDVGKAHSDEYLRSNLKVGQRNSGGTCP